MSSFSTLSEMFSVARNRLEKGDWDYLVGGSDTESTLLRNRSALDSWAFVPRILNDVSNVSYSTSFLNYPLRIPVILPPIGSIQAFDPKGACAVAEGARNFGTLQILSSACSPDFGQVASEVEGPRIYQLYVTGDQKWLFKKIEEIIEYKYIGLCFTADTQVYSRRERDIFNHYLAKQVRDTIERTGNMKVAARQEFNLYQSKLSWKLIESVKEKFNIPIIIKGVMSEVDAKRCVDVGVDAIYVSNHGGRQLDHARACIDCLPNISAAVAGRIPVIVDGGFMRGADVLKGLCLGASMVGIGRLEALAVAAGGANGLVQALSLLEEEIRISLKLLGASSINELGPQFLFRESGPNRRGFFSSFPLADDYFG